MTQKPDCGDAYILQGFGGAPYTVESYKIGHCVVSSGGYRVLRFRSKPDAVYTPDLAVAEEMARRANGEKP